MGAWGFLFLLAIFPILYVFLLITGTLAYLYNPFWRISAIILICSAYFWYGTHKKYTKRQNDFLENLSLQSRRTNGIEYFYTANHAKKTTSITTWIEGIYGYDFSLKFEGKFERFFKALGFNAECQTGEKRFDEMVYIVSDDEWLCQELKYNEAFRKTLYDIFWCYDEHNFDIMTIACFDGRLLVTAVLKYEEEIEGLDESLVNSFTKELVPLMQTTISHLPSKQTIDEKLYREKTNSIAFGFYVLIVALLINGLSVLVLDMQSILLFPKLVGSFSIIPLSIKVTVIILIILCILAFVLLRKSSRFAPFMFVLLTTGLLGIFTTTLVEVREINYIMDAYPDKVVVTQILKKEKKGSRHTKYYLDVQDWTNPREIYSIRVDLGLYNQFAVGNRVKIVHKKGFLGFPWIKHIEISQ